MSPGQADEGVDEPRRLGGDRLAPEVPAQILCEFGGVRVPLAAILLHAFRHDRGEVAAQPVIPSGERRRVGFGDQAGDLVDGPPVNVVRETAGQQFVQHDAQRVDIGPDVEVIHHPVELLGAHVLQRAHDASVASQHRGERRVLLHASGDTEIDDLRLAGRPHQNIARL